MKKVGILTLTALSFTLTAGMAVTFAKQQQAPIETRAQTGVDKDALTKATSIDEGKDYWLGIYDDDSNLFPFNLPMNNKANWTAFNNSATECISVAFEKGSSGYAMTFVYNSTTYYIGYSGQNWTYSTTNPNTDWALQSDSTLKTADGSYVIGHSSATSTFMKLLASTDYPLYLYVEGGGEPEKTAEEYATEYAEDFLSVECSVNKTNWASYKAKFEALSEDAQEILTKASADSTVIGRCVERYDLVLSLYGIASYENFMNRTIVDLSSIGGHYLTKEDKNSYISLIAVGGALIALVGGTILIKKRKAQ